MHKVIMPQLGESVVEGTVSRWLVQIGQAVKEFDPLLEVSTDKVDTEVPAPAGGTLLQIYVEEGSTVAAGVLLAVIGTPGEAIPEGDTGGATHGHVATPASAPATAPQAVSAAPVNGGGRSLEGMRISPVVARMAAEHNLDLTRISGTGRDGRVTKKDVEAYLEQQGGAAPAATELPPWEQPGSGDLFKPTGDFKPQTTPPIPAPAPTTPPVAPARTIPVEPIPQGAAGELMPLNNMRRAIAEHMVRSKLHTSPHVTTVFEVDMTNVLAHRAAHKDDFAKQGVNLTLTAYFIGAMVTASRAYPIINSQWTDEGIYFHHHINVGMAVALDDGLIVPVIKNVEDMSLLGIARKINDLANRARNKRLVPDELQGGTITITNHGVSGSLVATPIINQPQAAILGVGMMEKRVKVINDAIAIRSCCYVSLTFDHRIADGATGDGWMLILKETLENWA